MPTDTMTVANTILHQLGGSGKLTAMLGAHSFTGDKDSLTFKFKVKANNGIMAVKVTLDPSDTYTVTFYNIKRRPSIVVVTVSDVYCDNLRAVIKEATGLYLSL